MKIGGQCHEKKRIVCAKDSTSAHKSLDEMQIRIGYLQNVKDKLEAKLNAKINIR